MANGGSSNDESWESWLGGWVQSAKEKSTTALEFVKKDLAEFSCTIQKETEKAMEKTSSSITKANTEQATSKVKAGISSFFDNISKALVIPPDDDDYIAMKVSADGTSLYDRGKARLHALQLDASTYIDPPHGSPEQYSMWLESFDMDEFKGEISEVLVSKVEVRALYTRLVPNEVSHADFWQRYFYKVHQLQCDEARKQALMRRADQTKGDSLSWEDDWSGGEEEDDGNQSDWEKMPRPPQSSLAQKVEQPPSDPPNSSYLETTLPVEENTKAPSELQDPDNQERGTKSLPPVEPERNDSSASECQFDTDPNSHPVASSSDQAPAVALSERPPAASVKNEETNGSYPSQPPPDLWSLHVPSETACASHPEIDNEGAESDAPVQPGSSPDAHHAEASRLDSEARRKVDAFSGAAAASMELPTPSNAVENLTADGACGAADMVDSPPPQLSNIPPSNLDIPAASSSPVPEPATVPEEVRSDEVETSDGADCNVASATVKETSEDIGEIKVDEEGKPEQPGSAEESSNSARSGDEVASEIGMRVKGDMVVIGERSSPSTDSSDTKDMALDEDWEKDFDVEVTEEDLKAAEDIAKKLGQNLDAEDDDWENWE